MLHRLIKHKNETQQSDHTISNDPVQFKNNDNYLKFNKYKIMVVIISATGCILANLSNKLAM